MFVVNLAFNVFNVCNVFDVFIVFNSCIVHIVYTVHILIILHTTICLREGSNKKSLDPSNDIILPDLTQDRKAIEVTRPWINSRFQLLDEHAKPLPPLRIPYKCVRVPISKSILENTGIECAQVRGMQSTPDYEEAFIKAGEWDSQFPGVVTVAVTPAVLEIYKKHFKGKNVDDPKASAQFRQALGVAVLANPEKFEYDCTDGAHRSKLGTEKFGPEVCEHCYQIVAFALSRPH